MIYKIKEYKNRLIEKAYKEGVNESKSFFGVDLPFEINVCILNERKEIDLFYKSKTESWVNAFGKPGNNTVYILDNKNMEKESSHKKLSNEEYSELIKHEICHVFYDYISDDCYEPLWLSEGLALNLAGQTKQYEPVIHFSHFLKSYEEYVDAVHLYPESAYAVKSLLIIFGKQKLLKLVSHSKEAKNKKEFAKLFKKMYGFDLSYKNFNNLLNKK
jgi:hypothetical protein